MATTPALERLMYNGIRYARLRAELLEVELSAERRRLNSMIVVAVVMALAALTFVNLLAGMIIAAAWETPWRMHALAGLAMVALAVAASAWAILGRLRRATTRPFAALLRDLRAFSDSRSRKGNEE